MAHKKKAHGKKMKHESKHDAKKEPVGHKEMMHKGKSKHHKE